MDFNIAVLFNATPFWLSFKYLVFSYRYTGDYSKQAYLFTDAGSSSDRFEKVPNSIPFYRVASYIAAVLKGSISWNFSE